MSYIPHVSRDPTVLRSGALTTSFDTTPVSMRLQNWNQLVVYMDLTLDTATDARVRFDVCSIGGDGVPVEADWYALPWQDGAGTSIAAGVCTVPAYVYEVKLTASGKYALPLPCNYKWLRIKGKATGTAGAATLGVYATTGMA